MSVPTQNSERLARMRALLEQHFHPTTLELIDDSHRHAGHAGAKGGGGHFRVRIVAEAFAALPQVKRHRLVYAALADLMPHDIHALSIEALTPAETTPSPRITENPLSQRIP